MLNISYPTGEVMVTKKHQVLPCLSWKGRSMPMSNKEIFIPGIVLAVFVLSTKPAYAYIDPGTGSMIVQAIAAAVLTAGAMAGVFWRAIKNFFVNMGKRRTDGSAQNDHTSDTNPIK